MRLSYVIVATFAILFAVASLVEGGGSRGKLGDLQSSAINQTERDTPEAADAVPTAQPGPTAAKIAVWSGEEEEEESESLWFQPDMDPGEGSSVDDDQDTVTPYDIRPAKPVFAAAGAAVATEQTSLRER